MTPAADDAILLVLGEPLGPQPGLELVEPGPRRHFDHDVDVLRRAWTRSVRIGDPQLDRRPAAGVVTTAQNG
jgi:hypothetical protein